MKKKHWYILAGLTIITFLMSSKKAFANVVVNQKNRECDPSGCGHFGASRGTRKHNGIDVISIPNENVLSPISGTVTRFPFPYGSDLRYTGIEIVNADYLVKLFYVAPIVAINSKVVAGQVVAKAQNISAKYTSVMTNHVHVEVYDRKTNALLDPTKLFQS